jgi:hypothetical protein
MNLSSLPYGSSLFEACSYPCLDKGKFLQLNNVFPLGTPPHILDKKITTYFGHHHSKSLIIPLKLPAVFPNMKSFSQYMLDSSIDYSDYPIDPAEVFWVGEVKGYITNKTGTTLRLYLPKLFSHFINDLEEGIHLPSYVFPVLGRGNGIESCFAVVPLLTTSNKKD